MSDDIVIRLRIQTADKIDVVSRLDMKCLCCPCCEESCIYCEAVNEFDFAADEIERLRAELIEWKQLAQERDPHSWANLASKKHGLENVRPVQSELRRRWT